MAATLPLAPLRCASALLRSALGTQQDSACAPGTHYTAPHKRMRSSNSHCRHVLRRGLRRCGVATALAVRVVQPPALGVVQQAHKHLLELPAACGHLRRWREGWALETRRDGGLAARRRTRRQQGGAPGPPGACHAHIPHIHPPCERRGARTSPHTQARSTPTNPGTARPGPAHPPHRAHEGRAARGGRRAGPRRSGRRGAGIQQ